MAGVSLHLERLGAGQGGRIGLVDEAHFPPCGRRFDRGRGGALGRLCGGRFAVDGAGLEALDNAGGLVAAQGAFGVPGEMADELLLFERPLLAVVGAAEGFDFAHLGAGGKLNVAGCLRRWRLLAVAPVGCDGFGGRLGWLGWRGLLGWWGRRCLRRHDEQAVWWLVPQEFEVVMRPYSPSPRLALYQ